MKCPVVVYKIVFLLQERIACFKYIQDLEVFQGRGKVGITEVISVQKMLRFTSTGSCSPCSRGLKEELGAASANTGTALVFLNAHAEQGLRLARAAASVRTEMLSYSNLKL